MEFKTLGEPERKLLLEALDFNIKNLHCQHCGMWVSYKDCGIMPKIDTKENATIICGRPLCTLKYLTAAEEKRGEST